jgi:hypothetical protein
VGTKINLNSPYDSFPAEYGSGGGVVNFYVDNFVMTDRPESHSIALLVEPRAIQPRVYDWIRVNYAKYKYVFTFDNMLLNVLPNAKLLIYGQITAEFPDKKTKDISMVCSDKGFCEGHNNRKRTATRLKSIIDTYGKFDGGSFADDKDIYSGYRFNVAMENYSDGYYFTEKICNCFASKVIPIYWGCPHIGEYFDTRGIIQVENPDNIPTIVQAILQTGTEEIYNSRLEAIENNFKTVQKYRSYAKLFLETYGDLLEELANDT